MSNPASRRSLTQSTPPSPRTQAPETKASLPPLSGVLYKPHPIQPSASTPNVVQQPFLSNVGPASTNALAPIFESFVTGPALQEIFPSTAGQLNHNEDSKMLKNLISLDFSQLKVPLTFMVALKKKFVLSTLLTSVKAGEQKIQEVTDLCELLRLDNTKVQISAFSWCAYSL